MMRILGTFFALILVACQPHSALAVSVTSGLIGYWPADGNGSDLSGLGRDLTLNESLGFGEGVAGQAFNFINNNAQYASRAVDDAAFDFGTSDFTLQVWANFATLSGEHTLMEKFTGAAGPGWTLTQLPGRNLRFHASEDTILDASIGNFTPNTWHNVLVRRSGNVFALFFDGTLKSSVTGNPNIDTVQPLRIGNRHGRQSFPMSGQIDEAAIWNRALTDAEIATIFEEFGSTQPPLAGPVVWPTSAGGNGHAYEFVPVSGIDWETARTAATGRTFGGVSGHLATVGSAAENAFLQNTILDAQDTHGISPFIEAWLGGYQTNPAGPANQSWTWVTGEPWSYTNWDFDEPNDSGPSGGNERYLGTWGPDGFGPIGTWNDQGGIEDPHIPVNIQGYLVEYAVPEPSGLIGSLAMAAGLLQRRRIALAKSNASRTHA